MTDKGKRDVSYLSKTLFIKGLQCHKALYLHKNHPELKDEVSDAKEALFSSGRDVGTFAQKLFPGGIEIPYEGLSLSDQIKQRSKRELLLYMKRHSAMKDRSVRLIFSIKAKVDGRSTRSRVQRA